MITVGRTFWHKRDECRTAGSRPKRPWSVIPCQSQSCPPPRECESKGAGCSRRLVRRVPGDRGRCARRTGWPESRWEARTESRAATSLVGGFSQGSRAEFCRTKESRPPSPPTLKEFRRMPFQVRQHAAVTKKAFRIREDRQIFLPLAVAVHLWSPIFAKQMSHCHHPP